MTRMTRMTWQARFALMWVLALTGCTTYEYEEEVFLSVDGSGSLRVSGSSATLEALHQGASTTEAMTARFRGAGFTLDSVRETERDGRRFIHVQGRFDAWNELCAHPAFADRECGIERSDNELTLRLTAPAPGTTLPDGVPPDARIALRFHFPSTVRYHNSRGGIERGNIIGWERTAAEHFQTSALRVEARFERRSVLATTLAVLGTAIGIVIGSVALALWVMVRKGRRQLALEGDGAHTSTAQGQS